MKLNSIHTKLLAAYPNQEELKKVLGFSIMPDDYINRCMNLFKRGYWSLVPFAFAGGYNFAIRLMPNKNLIDSPIVYLGKNDAVTLSPRLGAFIPFFSLCFFDNKSFVTRIKENLGDVERLASAFLNVTNDLLALDFFIKFLEDDRNIERLQDEDAYEKIYRTFWNYYNDNSEQKRYDALLDKAINKPFFKPDLEPLDFGIWNNRVSSILAKSAYFNLKWEFNDKQDIYWQFLAQAHGVDTVKEICFVPDSSSNSAGEIILLAEEFDTDPFLERKFSQQIVEHPLYNALQEVRLKKQSYLGEKHVEAAAIFDLELNDPVNSLNALISASYWAGKNGNQAIEPIWEAAIFLAEKENWKEIHQVLTDQYAFYNFYKDKV